MEETFNSREHIIKIVDALRSKDKEDILQQIENLLWSLNDDQIQDWHDELVSEDQQTINNIGGDDFALGEDTMIITKLEWTSIGNKAVVTDPERITQILSAPQDWPEGMLATTLDGKQYIEVELYNKHVIVLDGESVFIADPRWFYDEEE